MHLNAVLEARTAGVDISRPSSAFYSELITIMAEDTWAYPDLQRVLMVWGAGTVYLNRADVTVEPSFAKWCQVSPVMEDCLGKREACEEAIRWLLGSYGGLSEIAKDILRKKATA